MASRTIPKAPLRVAMVGLGFFGRYQFHAWQRLKEVEVVAVCEHSKETRGFLEDHPQVTLYSALDALLAAETPGILDIATPPHAHAQLIRTALGEVETIICQKPFCTSLEEAREIVSLAESAGTKLIVHENFRFQPWYRKIRELIQSGRIGQVRQAHFRLRPGDGEGEEAYVARQPYFREMKRFLVHETGIHLIDVFRYLFGEVRGVYADLWQSNASIAGEDSGYFILEMQGGVRALFDGNRTLDHAAENRRLTMGEMVVEGSDGELRLDGWGKLALRGRNSTTWQEIELRFEDRDFGGDCVFRFQQHVVRHLLEGAKLENAARSYLVNMEIEAAAYTSAQQGRLVGLT